MDETTNTNTRGRNILIGLVAIVVLVGLGYIFRPATGTVAGVNTTTPYTPTAPGQTTGTLQGTVRALPTY